MKITKRNGKVVVFDNEKVIQSILKANADAAGETVTAGDAAVIADIVFARVTEGNDIITTGDVTKCVHEVLLERKLPATAAGYLSYAKAKHTK